MMKLNNSLRVRVATDVPVLDILRKGFEYVMHGDVDFLSPGKYDDFLVYPNTLAVEVGSRCEAGCKACYVEDRAKDITFPKKRIDELLIFAKLRGVNYVSILGGEPFHPANIETTLYMAEKDKNMDFVACTNGMHFLNGDVLDRIKKRRNLTVIFSVDGLRDVNDSVRGNGSFDISVSAMNEYRKKVRRPFGVYSTLSGKNYQEVSSEKFIKEMCSKGAYLFSYSPCYTPNGYDLNPHQYSFVILNLKELSKKVPAILTSSHFGQLYSGEIDLTSRPQPVLIDYEGNVYMTRRGKSYGNIVDEKSEGNSHSLIGIIGTKEFQEEFIKKHYKFNPANHNPNQDLFYQTLECLANIYKIKPDVFEKNY